MSATFDKENIMMIEFTKIYNEGVEIPMIALFNKKKVAEKDVRLAIALYGTREFDNIVFITKTQYDSVFMRHVES